MAGASRQMGDLAPLAERTIRILTTISLVLLFAFLLSKLFWLVVAGPQSVISALPAQNRSPTSSASVVDTSILVRTSPFRATAPLAPIEIDVEEETPETELNLLLNGVRTDGDGEGVAFITGDDGDQVRYYRGDAVKGYSNVVVDRIYADGVILLRNGRVEKLTTKDLDGVRAIKTVAEADLRRDESVDKDKKQTVPEVPVEDRSSSDGNEIASKPQSARLTKSEMLSFMQWARIDAQTQDNVPGVTVFPTNGAIFKKSGLRSRDVIQSIGGVTLTQGVDYARLFEDIQSDEKVEIRLLRSGAPVDLTIRMSGE